MRIFDGVLTIAKDASKVEDDVSNELVALLSEVTDAIKRKAAIIGLELEDGLKWLSTGI